MRTINSGTKGFWFQEVMGKESLTGEAQGLGKRLS